MNTPAKDSTYFSLQAMWGITNHIGGLRATRMLVRACGIREEDHVLVVGCGNGKTIIHLAKQHRCRVMSIDISGDMVELARKRAAREGVAGQTEFHVADAQQLPFADSEFDAVICESVNSFVPDKLKAMQEYHRVVRPGRRVGINEVTWLQPPTPKIVDYFIDTMGACPLDAEGWADILETAGLGDVTRRVFRPNMLTMWYDELQQMGITGMFVSWARFFLSLLKWSPELRRFVRKTWPPPWNILSYMGYGIYTGTK